MILLLSISAEKALQERQWVGEWEEREGGGRTKGAESRQGKRSRIFVKGRIVGIYRCEECRTVLRAFRGLTPQTD